MFKQKSVFVLIAVLFVNLLFVMCSCGGKSFGDASVEDITGVAGETTDDNEKTAVIYLADVESGKFSKKAVSTNGIPEDIINALINNGSFPEGAALNSFKQEDNIARIDMNKAYGDAVCSGTYAEWQYIGVLVNSFLDSYGLEGIYLTVEGEILVTGHYGAFDELLGYQKDLF